MEPAASAFVSAVALLAVLGGAMSALHVAERRLSRLVAHRLGWRAVLVTGWIGVPVHELAHLVLARLVGHRIIAYRLFEPDPASGTLGYVRHAYRRRSPLQPLKDLAIALAPIGAGVGALLLLTLWCTSTATLVDLYRDLRITTTGLEPASAPAPLRVASALLQVMTSLAHDVWQARTPWLPLQLYLVAAVASHMAPSLQDLRPSAWWLPIGFAGLALALVLLPQPALPLTLLVTALLACAATVALGFQLVYGTLARLIPL